MLGQEPQCLQMAENLQTDLRPDQHVGSEQQHQKPLQLPDQLCDELRRVAQEHFASMDRAIQRSLRRCLFSHVPSSSYKAQQILPGRVDDDIAATPGADARDESAEHAWADSQQAGVPSLLNELSSRPPKPQAPDGLIHSAPPLLPSTTALMNDDLAEFESLDGSRHDASMPHNESKQTSFMQVLPADGADMRRSSMGESSRRSKRGSVSSPDPRFVARKSDRKRISCAEVTPDRKSMCCAEEDGKEHEQEDDSHKKNTMLRQISKMRVSNISLLRWVSPKTGLQRRASLFTSSSKRLILEAQQTLPQRIVSNKFWAVTSLGLIILNSILTGWQTQAMALRTLEDIENGRDLRVEEPIGFTVAQLVFTLLFSFELAMRWLAEGLRAFLLVDTSWNLLDFMVVVLGWADVLMLFVIAGGQQQSSTLMTFRVMRVLRVIRIGRMIRMMKFFRELRMMIYSILASFKSLGWVCIILIIMFYMFGISFTAGVTDYLVSHNARQQEDIEGMVNYFGTLGRSILTLYMSMTGGDDWRVFHNSLKTLPFFYRHLFIVFITFAILAVFNIVTGVFVESAMASSQQDREAVVQDEIEAKRSYFKAMETLFEEMDDDDSGTITLEEFESRLDDERVAAYFNSLKLDVSDAKMLFQLLDRDGSDEISYSEFVSGCQRLQGEATSLDAKVMHHEVKYLKNQLDYVIEFLDQLPKSRLCQAVA